MESEQRTETTVLTIEIAGDWTADDFLLLFAAIKRLHLGIQALASDEKMPRLDPRHFMPLRIRSVEYASPGGIDINIPLGDLGREFREAVKDATGRNRQEKEARAIAIDASKEALEHQRAMHTQERLSGELRLIRESVQMLRLAGVSEEEIQRYVASAVFGPMDDLGRLADAGKITGVADQAALPSGE